MHFSHCSFKILWIPFIAETVLSPPKKARIQFVCVLRDSAGGGAGGFYSPPLLSNLIRTFDFLYEHTHSRSRNTHRNVTFSKYFFLNIFLHSWKMKTKKSRHAKFLSNLENRYEIVTQGRLARSHSISKHLQEGFSSMQPWEYPTSEYPRACVQLCSDTNLSSVYCLAVSRQNSAAPRAPQAMPYRALFKQPNGPWCNDTACFSRELKQTFLIHGRQPEVTISVLQSKRMRWRVWQEVTDVRGSFPFVLFFKK